jgi:isoamylase
VHVKGFTMAHPGSRWSWRGTYAGLGHQAAVAHLVDLGVTAEGDHLGPTLCHRGLDNPAYYRLEPADPGRYVDTTGCGHALNAGDPVCLRLIMDSLRYWLTEMGVDGFRFDLAPTLARQDGGFDRLSAFFDLVAQDPVVSRAKLIAEPWDVGQPDSYDVGRFLPGWSEWNGRYRDTMRDLVSYDRKHNEANGEDNRDGTDDNRSWNCGMEGPSSDPAIVELCARRSRALLTTLPSNKLATRSAGELVTLGLRSRWSLAQAPSRPW